MTFAIKSQQKLLHYAPTSYTKHMKPPSDAFNNAPNKPYVKGLTVPNNVGKGVLSSYKTLGQITTADCFVHRRS